MAATRHPVARAAAVTTLVLALVAGAAAAGAATRTGTAATGATRPMRSGDAPNFVSVCRYSHQLPDDPIVHPARPGASHLHDFFANRTTDAHSTEQSLRDGQTTCRHGADLAAYWAPSLYDDGIRVAPTHVRAYYTTGGKSAGSIEPFPSGLRVVTSQQHAVRWACVGRGVQSAGSAAVPTCAPGTHLVVRIGFPDCWDGRSLDSADHASHMAFAVRSRGADARRACPASHPVPLPRLSTNVHYPSDGGSITLAAQSQPHADFFNAWDDEALRGLVERCLNARVHCGAVRG